jgi:hypothetical protein
MQEPTDRIQKLPHRQRLDIAVLCLERKAVRPRIHLRAFSADAATVPRATRADFSRLSGTQLLQLLTQTLDRVRTPFIGRQQLEASDLPLGIVNSTDAKFLLAEEVSSPRPIKCLRERSPLTHPRLRRHRNLVPQAFARACALPATNIAGDRRAPRRRTAGETDPGVVAHEWPNVCDEPRAKAHRFCESGDQRERTPAGC